MRAAQQLRHGEVRNLAHGVPHRMLDSGPDLRARFAAQGLKAIHASIDGEEVFAQQVRGREGVRHPLAGGSGNDLILCGGSSGGAGLRSGDAAIPALAQAEVCRNRRLVRLMIRTPYSFPRVADFVPSNSCRWLEDLASAPLS